MVPAVGVRTPDRQSKYVVLPAPLGPMSPHTSREKKATLTSESARTPPKVTVTPRVSRMGCRSDPTPASAMSPLSAPSAQLERYLPTMHASEYSRVAVLGVTS